MATREIYNRQSLVATVLSYDEVLADDDLERRR